MRARDRVSSKVESPWSDHGRIRLVTSTHFHSLVRKPALPSRPRHLSRNPEDANCRLLSSPFIRTQASPSPLGPSEPGAGEASEDGSRQGKEGNATSASGPDRGAGSFSGGAAENRGLTFPKDFLSAAGGAKASRRLLVSVAGAVSLAVGANFLGVTSALLSSNPDEARNLKLDLIYPVLGYKRCLDMTQGFEFMYPSAWLADQTLLYRAAQRSERQRSLDPLPLSNSARREVSSVGGGTGAAAVPVEPLVAYGPAGGSGELNISVIVADVDVGFRLDRFGGAEDVGNRLLENVIAPKGSSLEATLLDASQRRIDDVLYYEIEFKVQGPLFKRHNKYVCCVYSSKLYSLNAMAPQDKWEDVKGDFAVAADSFRVKTG